MTKFNDMQYVRPDFADYMSKFKGYLDDMKNAKDKDAFIGAMMNIDALMRNLGTLSTLVSIRNSINTKDEFYNKEQEIMDENLPQFAEIGSTMAQIVLSSPFRKDVEEKFGKHLTEKYALKATTFKPEIVPDLIEESKLSTEYEKFMASAEIEFEGKTYNLSGMTPFMQSTDRQTRKAASDAYWGWLADRVNQLDEFYDKPVKIRHNIAIKLGFKNFIELAYARMGRTDWTYEDARNYRKQIYESVVPLAQKLYKEQADRLNIHPMKYYDYNLEFLTGNPKPVGEEAYLVEQAKEMYEELSPLTGEFFNTMINQELMDLTTKPGKRGGGYMTFLPDYKVPFIFSNFNGTSGDVDVLTHEAGHAFQGYVNRNAEFSDQIDYTMEVAEIHSMSMEFFTHPWMQKFFGKDTEKYYYSHVVSCIHFLPYGASIDEFQEWVYLHVDATPEERRAQYREIERKYLPHLDYDDCEYLQGGGRWQRQMHVYFAPFYYLDYTLSQVCALQYFIWDMKDHKKAWESYLHICERAGIVPFTELVKECGLDNPFEDGTIAKITPKLEQYLDSLDKSQIK